MGQSLARVSMLATLALLLSRFSFKLADQVNHPFCLVVASSICSTSLKLLI